LELCLHRVPITLCNISYFSHCKGDSIEQEFCPRSVCSIYTVWSQWSDWSQCSKTCGEGGVRTRTRECPGEKSHPSVTCGENRLEREHCNTHACSDHAWAEWGEWSKCPNLMTKKQMRKRECVGSKGPRKCTGLFFNNKFSFLYLSICLFLLEQSI
jgi:Thrombospondin type 1 domain.